jgi:hypothetical protein
MDKKLKYYGGQGYDYSSESGTFEVRTRTTERFTKLSEARKYYDSLNEEKAIWDITSVSELLECHTF